MAKPRLSLVVCVCLAAAAALSAQTSYVFQLPGTALAAHPPQIEGLGDDSFGRTLGPVNSASLAGATKVLATPTGSKFYIVTPQGMLLGNSSLTTVTPLSGISGTVNDAAITPDGKYLLVAASHFYIIDTSTNTLAVAADTGIPSGSTPTGVAVSHDGKTAWVLSNANTGSLIASVDLTTLQATPSQLSLITSSTSIVLSPGGLLYVTSATRLYEIDPITMTVTPLGQIQIPGQAGPLQFTPDGTAAYFVDQTSCGSCSPIFKLSVQSHSITTWFPTDGSTPPVLDQVLVAGNNRIFGFSSASTTLYDITPSPLTVAITSLGQLPTTSVVAAAVSNENPNSRFLYVLFSDHTFDRVNLTTNGIDQQARLDPVDGLVFQFVPIPVQSGAANLSLINGNQSLVPSATAVLIGQVLDAVGRPVIGASATFSADPVAGIAITTPTVTTTAGGWAQTTITAPVTPGNYSVTLTAAGLSGTFQLNVNGSNSGGNTGAGAGTPQMSIYAGDGQLLRQNESTIETQVPLTVKIVDATGTPLPNVAVSFSVVDGIGTVTTINAVNQGVTDAGGLARANFNSAIIQSGTLALSKIDATSPYGTVEFYEVTQDAPVNALHQPNATLITPSQSRSITAPRGGVVSAGIATQIVGDAGQFIPNVGLRLADPSSPTSNSKVATCQGLSRSDNSGISRCDVLVTTCQLGDFGVFVYVGELIPFSLTIHVTNGSASLLTPISSLNQAGTPGSTFSLLARVTDGCGQPIATTGLNWGIIQGTNLAKLSNQQSASDGGGNVSAQIQLLQTAGTVKVQLSGSGLAPIVFTITNAVSVSGITPVSGGGQSVVAGQPFPQPLVFFVHDGNNQPVSGATVTFGVSGSATLSSPGSAVSSTQGLVQATVTAGATAGNIVVTATTAGFNAVANLSSRAAGPTIGASNFTNAASGSVGMTPCGFVTVTGTGVAPAVQGVVTAVTFFGALPYTLGGLTISVNGIPVPIQAIANDQFGQRANFQAPCELTGSSATVVVTSNNATTTIPGVPVFSVQPGIFTYTGSNNKVYGGVIREVDGTYVTSANPARQGEKVYVVATGLGQTTPALVTNSVGTGNQNVNLPVAVLLGVDDAHLRGLPALSARYLFGWVGAYLIEFQIPSDTPIGPDQHLIVVETSADGNVFLGISNSVLLPAVSAP